ncbi:MAG: RNA polymerase sigma factor [Gammaproteobacteria bacterium]
MIFGKNEFRHKLEASRDRLYRVAYSWCHDPALADDLVQTTMVKALRSAKQLRNGYAMDAWLYRILANSWRNHLSRTREMVSLDDSLYESQLSITEDFGREEIVDRVRAAIAQLPLGQREAITLVVVAGFSYAEIAEILSIPIGTVMSRICRARQALKERLQDLHAERRDDIRLRRIK